MELVNKEFAKLDKIDLICLMSDESNNVVSGLLNTIIQYETINNNYVGEFYINTNGIYFNELNNIHKFMISRNSLLNAFIYAGYNHDLEELFKLNNYISSKYVSLEELGNLSDYVLCHSIDFDEYCDGEKEKLIFDEVSNTFIKNFVFKNNSNKKFFKKI